jgi:hypothetical protein
VERAFIDHASYQDALGLKVCGARNRDGTLRRAACRGQACLHWR